MSFRRRLALFFVLIVIAPMIAVAILVTQVAGESASGKTDAALTEDLEVATALYDELVADALETGERLVNEPRVSRALANGDEARLADVLSDLASRHDLASLSLVGPSGEEIVHRGARRAFATGTINLDRQGDSAGALTVSTSTVRDYARRATEATGERVVVILGNGEAAGVLEVDPGEIPAAGEAGDVTAAGDDLRAVSAALPGSDGARVAVLTPAESGGFLASRPGIAVALLVFIALAMLAAGAITRTLQGQIATMLEAAKRIGQGDFSGEVPVLGDDEMAGLAGEFNEMRDRLSTQMAQLERQRREIESSVNRIGEAFASGLDPQALLEILIETAVGACDAEYGLVALSGRVGAEAESGTANDEIRDVALAAERGALRRGEAVRGEREGTFALSAPLGRIGSDREPVGAMTVARTGRAFSASEQNVFYYLAGQAAASIENVALHEMVTEQAITDELTGLPNTRAFRDSIEKEAARAARFRHDLSLLMLDIDDFKEVNDTYGHLQGDAVLRAVGRILGAESRGIDEPARYGGEEFVVALPETGPEGALELGERIRALIAEEKVARVDGKGEISVTASFGAATMPGAGQDAIELIAAADAALYEAKRTGKNRVVVAEGNGAGWRTDAE